MTPPPALQALMRLAVEVGEITSIGVAPNGERRFVAISGGSFESADAASCPAAPTGNCCAPTACSKSMRATCSKTSRARACR
jgi:hypothetical protein